MKPAAVTKQSLGIFLLLALLTSALLAAFQPYLTDENTFFILFFVWIYWYGFMFSMAYPIVPDAKRLVWTTLIPSFVLSVLYYWSRNTLSISQQCVLLMVGFALNAFHIHFLQYRWKWHYPALFVAVWDTAARFLITIFLVLICIIIAFLCASLFLIININALTHLLSKTWFLVGFINFLMIMSVHVLIHKEIAVKNTRVALTFISHYLLIVLSVISLIFLLVLIIHFQFHFKFYDDFIFALIGFLSVLFLNGVYQDGTAEKSAFFFSKSGVIPFVFVILSPIFSFLTVFHFSVTPFHFEDFFYFISMLLLLMYNAVYSVCFLSTKRNIENRRVLEKANIVMGFVLIAIVIITSNPFIQEKGIKPLFGNTVTSTYKRASFYPLIPMSPKTRPAPMPPVNQGSWLNTTGGVIPSNAFVVGDNHGPLYICKSTVPPAVGFPGVVQNHVCTLVQDKKIIQSTQFTVYAEPTRKVYWSTFYPLQDGSLRVNVGAPGHETYVCRTIYQNRIHVGFLDYTLGSFCIFVSNGKIIYSQDIPQYLYLNNA